MSSVENMPEVQTYEQGTGTWCSNTTFIGRS
jgi:hypothetical protein